MNNNFVKAMEFTLPWEVGRDKKGNLRQDGGLNCNDGKDNLCEIGELTKWGLNAGANPTVDIANLTLDGALEIYKIKYYEIYRTKEPVVLNLDDCPMPYAVAIFDTGVNCGVNRTYKWHQVAIETKDPVKTLLGLRDAHYTNLKAINFTKYGRAYKGWINRLNDLKKYCVVLAQE
jgi:hypothetical protein